MQRLILLILFVLLTGVSRLSAQSATLTITSPQPYQVFQRLNGCADIWITGRVSGMENPTIEASANGTDWYPLKTRTAQQLITYGLLTTIQRPLTRNVSFGGLLEDVPQGQYTLYVRIAGTDIVQTVPYVGVGDVFVLAGQSNASGRGYQNQAYSHPTLKASMFGNDYRWHELKDPVDSPAGTIDSISMDSTASGSYWPLLASYIMADQGVPVAFIPVAKGGSTITQWQPIIKSYGYSKPANLYSGMWQRISSSRTAIKAILWHQGEQDAYRKLSTAAYVSQLNILANAVMRDFRAPMLVAELQAIRTNAPVYTLRINQAIEQVIVTNVNVLPGADFRDMQTDDTAHFQSNEKLQLAAYRWWLALDAEVYR